MTRPRPRRLIATLSTILGTIGGIEGCASARHAEPALSPEFYGVWAAQDIETRSWWEIRADRAVNYEASVDGQACEGRAVIVVSGDVLDDCGTRRAHRSQPRVGAGHLPSPRWVLP
jgi:hypothetical protein